MEATMAEPRVRVRTNLKRTQRDGWKLDETTAEIEWGWGDPRHDMRVALGRLMRDAYEEGVIEARRRNEAEMGGR